MNSDLVFVEFPSGPVTVNETVFNPELEYVTVCGPAVFAVAGDAPVPKFHEYVVMVPVDAFVNVVDCPVQITRLFAVKSAEGTTAKTLIVVNKK